MIYGGSGVRFIQPLRSWTRWPHGPRYRARDGAVQLLVK